MGKGGGGISAGGLGGTITKFNNSISGVDKQAKYAQQAAMAEQAKREAVTAEARASRDRLNLAAQSPQQLAALEKGLSAAQAQVDTDLRQLAAIDPAIMEASKQVMTLLQGGRAAVNDPLMQQRDMQRKQLVDSLRAQYGPGAESSSIGQRALQQFDMQSNMAFQQNQQNTLGNLFGMATTRVNGAGFGNLMTAQQGFGDYQNRILGAQQAGDQNVLAAMGGEVAGAGAQYVGNMIQAGAQRQFFTDIHNDGRQIGRAWGSMGKAKGGGEQAQNTQIGFNGSNSQYGGDMSSGYGDMSPMSNGGSFGQRGM